MGATATGERGAGLWGPGGIESEARATIRGLMKRLKWLGLALLVTLGGAVPVRLGLPSASSSPASAVDSPAAGAAGAEAVAALLRAPADGLAKGPAQASEEPLVAAAKEDLTPVQVPVPELRLEASAAPGADGAAGRAARRPVSGTLLIPRLGIEAPIVHLEPAGGTWDVSHLTQEVAYLAPTAPPGRPGNFALAAHVTLPPFGVSGPFRRLAQLAPGDEVTVRTDRYLITYRITGSLVVRPQDIWVLEPGSGHRVTLITCTGWDPRSWEYQNRLVVQGELVHRRLLEPIPSIGSRGILRHLPP